MENLLQLATLFRCYFTKKKLNKEYIYIFDNLYNKFFWKQKNNLVFCVPGLENCL